VESHEVNGNAIELGRTNIPAPLFRIQTGDVVASRSKSIISADHNLVRTVSRSVLEISNPDPGSIAPSRSDDRDQKI
jgi:hypothetical protein